MLAALLVIVAAGEVRPKLEAARLVVGTAEASPVRIEEGRVSRLDVGDHVVEVRASTISIAGGPAPVALTRSDLTHVGSSGSIAWFASPADFDGAVHGFDVESGAWIAPWKIDDEALGLEAPRERRRLVCAVEAFSDSRIVLAQEFPESALRSRDDRHMTGYCVASFDAKSHVKRWVRRFDAASPMEEPGAFLLGPMTTRPLASRVTPMRLFNGHVLACAGEREPIFCFTAFEGHVAWQVERLWEFERTYVGPSIWEH